MKPSTLNFTALVAAIFATSAPFAIADEATTDPVGFLTLSVKGHGGTKASEFTYLGLGMARPIAYQAVAETVSGTTLTCSTATWTDNQYASTPQPGYFVEIGSGAKTGLLSQVVSSNDAANTLTVADDLTALGVEGTNVVFKIRPNWSLATLFGATNSAGFGAGSSTTADLILIYNPNLGGGAGGYDTFFYSSGGIPGVGWRQTGQGSADKKDAPIALDEALIIKRLQSADLNVTVSGAVKLGNTITTVFTGANFIGNVYPGGVMTLGNTDLGQNPPRYSSGLYTGSNTTGVKAGSSTTADLILVYNPTLGGGAGGYDTYFYSSGGIPGVGWRQTGQGSANKADVALETGRAIFVKRQTDAGGAFNWVAPQPFPNP